MCVSVSVKVNLCAGFTKSKCEETQPLDNVAMHRAFLGPATLRCEF